MSGPLARLLPGALLPARAARYCPKREAARIQTAPTGEGEGGAAGARRGTAAEADGSGTLVRGT